MTVTSSPIATVGKPRSLTSVILRSVASGLLYYGYYKWMIQDELKTYAEQQFDKSSNALSNVWPGAVCIIPFVLGIATPLVLAKLDPDVPSWFGWLAFFSEYWARR